MNDTWINGKVNMATLARSAHFDSTSKSDYGLRDLGRCDDVWRSYDPDNKMHVLVMKKSGSTRRAKICATVLVGTSWLSTAAKRAEAVAD